MIFLLVALIIAMVPTALLGMLMMFHILRPQKSPADTSNRFGSPLLEKNYL